MKLCTKLFFYIYKCNTIVCKYHPHLTIIHKKQLHGCLTKLIEVIEKMMPFIIAVTQLFLVWRGPTPNVF